MKSYKKEILIFIGIAILFLALRVPAIHNPYHQDEYKWPIIVNPTLTAPGGIPHPPLGETIYRTGLYAFGSDNFRIIPFIFGFANLVLIYFIVRRRYSLKAAQWSALFFTLSYYSVLASLMVDTDGQILPFFFLLALWCYDSFNLSENKQKWLWLGLFIVSITLGMLVKVSFLLPIGAFILDFLIEKEIFKDKKKFAKTLGFGILGVLILAVLFYFSKFIFPFFNLQFALKYWEGFMKGFGSRNFFQTGIQFVKAIFYLSPALVLAGLISLFPYCKTLKLFHIFIGLGLMFYLVLFDFSQGALDRYFQFLIIPLCIIAGVLFAEMWQGIAPPLRPSPKGRGWGGAVYLLFIIPILIFFVQFINQYVPPLYPKAEWISRFLSLKWNFLFPFTGGSGPLGFYISFLFIALSFIYAAILVALYFIKKELKPQLFVAIFILGLVYNLSFTEEYLFGKINGSAPKLVEDATAFIKNDKDIKMVTVYNDNGGYDIIKTGKYRKRLYVDPKFDIAEKVKTLNSYKEHYLVIEIPRIDPESIYAKYFNSCKVVFEEEDKYIPAKIYDCRNAPNLKIK